MGSFRSAINLNTTTNHALFRFKSDSSVEGRGFNIRFRASKRACRRKKWMRSSNNIYFVADCHKIIRDHQGVIESPNFPNSYSDHLNCEWKLIPSAGNNVSVEFTHFDLERTSSYCIYDYVTILEANSEGMTLNSEKYCNEKPPPLNTNKTVVIRYGESTFILFFGNLWFHHHITIIQVQNG